MNTFPIKPKHEDSAIGQLLGLKSLLAYYEKDVMPFYAEMEEWEAKEYRSGHNQCAEEFETIKKHILNNEGVFNILLSEYNLSVAVFINKYILN